MPILAILFTMPRTLVHKAQKGHFRGCKGDEGGGGSSSDARLSYTGPMDWFKKTSSFDFEYSSNTQLRLKIFSFFLDTHV